MATFAAARRIGVDTHAHVMLGMPGETAETMERTIEYVVNTLRPTTATFGSARRIRARRCFEEVRAVHPQIGDGTSVNLETLHLDGFYNQFYTSLRPRSWAGPSGGPTPFLRQPGYVLGWLARLRSPHDLRR